MLRPIDGFHQDKHGDWVAELRCGHGQHVRHKPPFWQRPWVVSDEGRASMLGTDLPCVLCERFEMPTDFRPYKRTADFTARSIPEGLKRHHSTKAGVWGVINVLEGRLRYIVEPPLVHDTLLEAGSRAVIVPEVLHRVEPDGEVRFFVELYRRAVALP
jgi:tellurite methyltransferase